MKSTILFALAVLNVLLLAMFISRITRENTALAQPRPRGEYLMVAGDVSALASQAIYVIDASNALLGAVSYDDTNNRLNAMAPISLAQPAAAAPGAAPTNVRPGTTPRRP